MLKANSNLKLYRAKSIAAAFQQLEAQLFDVILLDFYHIDGTVLYVINDINNRQIATPVVCIADRGSDEIAGGFGYGP